MGWKEKYKDVFLSGNYHGRKEKIVRLAQLNYRHNRADPKVYALCEALELYEAMSGDWFDPTADELDEMLMEVY